MTELLEMDKNLQVSEAHGLLEGYGYIHRNSGYIHRIYTAFSNTLTDLEYLYRIFQLYTRFRILAIYTAVARTRRARPRRRSPSCLPQLPTFI